jgi:hypothetical protein
LCYAEFSAVLPVEGSAYAYSYGTVGEIFAWIIGWNLILEYMMGATTVAVSWSGYFGKLLDLLHVHLPIWLMMDYSTAKATVADAMGVSQVQTYLANVNPKLDVKLLSQALVEKKDALKTMGLHNSKEVVKHIQSQLPDMATIKNSLKGSKEAFNLIKEAKSPTALIDVANGSNSAELQKHYSSINLPGFAVNLPVGNIYLS